MICGKGKNVINMLEPIPPYSLHTWMKQTAFGHTKQLFAVPCKHILSVNPNIWALKPQILNLILVVLKIQKNVSAVVQENAPKKVIPLIQWDHSCQIKQTICIQLFHRHIWFVPMYGCTYDWLTATLLRSRSSDIEQFRLWYRTEQREACGVLAVWNCEHSNRQISSQEFLSDTFLLSIWSLNYRQPERHCLAKERCNSVLKLFHWKKSHFWQMYVRFIIQCSG